MKKLAISVLLIIVLALGLASATVTSVSTITAQSADPGSSATFTLTFNSDGATAVVVSTTSSALTDGSNTITAPTISDVTIAAGDTSEATTFTVSVPAGTDAGAYTGTLTYEVDGVTTALTDNNYVLTVDDEDAFTLSETSMTLTVQTDKEGDTFIITNTGSTTLSTFAASFESDDGDSNKILDEDEDEVTITFSGVPTELEPGETATVTVYADPETNMNAGTYDGTITLTSGTLSSTIDLSVVEEADICENGEQGDDFNIDIRSPDSGDDFSPGDVADMEVKVENNAGDDVDVKVVTILYDMTTGEKIDSDTQTGSIDEDDTETFSYEFELPTDLEEDDDYEIFVKVYDTDQGEEDSCNYESIEIDISRDSSTGKISSTSVTPEIGLTCYDDYRVSVTVESTGDDTLENAYMELADGDLEVSETTENFDLGDYNDEDNEERFSFDLRLPKEIATGTYSLEAIFYDENGDILDSELINIEVESCTSADLAGDLEVEVSNDYTVKGDELTLSLVITNNGEDSATITVTPDEVTWATLTGTEYLKSLQAGDQIHAYLYYTLDTAETAGTHDLKITVIDDRGNEVSDIVAVDFGEEVATEEDSFFSGIGDWFSENVSFWIIADVILLILGIAFAIMFFSKK